MCACTHHPFLPSEYPFGVQARVQGILLLDPTEDETAREDAGMMIAMTGISGEVTEISLRGKWANAELKEAVELCLGGCEQLDAAGRSVLKESVATNVFDGVRD